MVYESIDHGNDVTCHAVPVVLFLVFRKKINVIVKNKLTIVFHGLHFYIDHRNDTIKCSKLCSETTRLRLVVPLEFWTFYDVIFMIYKNLKYMAVNNSLFLVWEIWLTPTKRDSSTRRAPIRVLQFYHPSSSQIRRTSGSSKEKVVRKNRHMLWRKMCATCVK